MITHAHFEALSLLFQTCFFHCWRDSIGLNQIILRFAGAFEHSNTFNDLRQSDVFDGSVRSALCLVYCYMTKPTPEDFLRLQKTCDGYLSENCFKSFFLSEGSHYLRVKGPKLGLEDLARCYRPIPKKNALMVKYSKDIWSSCLSLCDVMKGTGGHWVQALGP